MCFLSQFVSYLPIYSNRSKPCVCDKISFVSAAQFIKAVVAQRYV